MSALIGNHVEKNGIARGTGTGTKDGIVRGEKNGIIRGTGTGEKYGIVGKSRIKERTLQKRWKTALSALLAVFLLIVEILSFPVSAMMSGTVAMAQYPSTKGRPGITNILASFPGLSLGGARIEKGRVIFSFDCAGADAVVALDGKAMRFEVKAGNGNNGNLCILLNEGCLAETYGTGRLLLKWERPIPQPGSMVHIGEAILALPRQPKPGELPISRIIHMSNDSRNASVGKGADAQMPPIAPVTTPGHMPPIAPVTTPGHMPPVAPVTTLGQMPPVAPVTTRPGLAMSSGYIVKLPLWVENMSGSILSISLGPAPNAFSGKLLAPVPVETLRYVSSDILLPADYQPNLRWTSNLLCLKQGESFQFHPDVVTALNAMLQSAQKQGVSGYDLGNSYRSAAWQKSLFERRLNWSRADKTITDPLAVTLRRVARPLGSEHQTGLAFDIDALTGYGMNFAKTPNYRWLMAEGWKYGFVVRYPDGWESATKVMFEPWHIRYFGKQMAGYLVQNKIPYEGFVAKAKEQGAVWLGDTEADSDIVWLGDTDADSDTVWLAVTATPDAVYASGENGQGPVISKFLPGQDIWMIPLGSTLTFESATSPHLR